MNATTAKAKRIGRSPTGGFTLVELLIVMGIILVLVGLLVPAVNRGMVMVAQVRTKSIIKNIVTAMEQYRRDNGQYPPKDGSDAAFQSLGEALVEKRYYESEDVSSSSVVIRDAFSPAKPIFYFVKDSSDADAPFKVGDNGSSDDDDVPDENFKDQNHLNLVTMYKGPTGDDQPLNTPYLLISCGEDRLWGYVREDYDGELVAATESNDDRWCDDIANVEFKKK